jgi:putative sigma-54 modulation protein
MVKKQCKTFEEAIELVAVSLERLLVKRKDENTYLIEKFF